MQRRDKTIANAHSISVARCGLIYAGSDNLSERNFLPFPELLELENGASENSTKKTISIDTAKEFLRGVNSGEIPYKVVSAATPYMDMILELGAK